MRFTCEHIVLFSYPKIKLALFFFYWKELHRYILNQIINLVDEKKVHFGPVFKFFCFIVIWDCCLGLLIIGYQVLNIWLRKLPLIATRIQTEQLELFRIPVFLPKALLPKILFPPTRFHILNVPSSSNSSIDWQPRLLGILSRFKV